MTVQDLWTNGRTGEPTPRYGRGKRWRAFWPGPDGKRWSKAFDSRAIATEFAAAMAADTAIRRAGAKGGSPALRALLARDGRTPLAALREHRGPVEVFLTKRDTEVTGRVYGEEGEECLAEEVMGSVSLRGAQREMTGLLLSRAYEPAGRWEQMASTKDGGDGETMRAFQRKQTS